MTWATLVVNVLAALGGLAGISALLNVLLVRKKTNAEAADIEQNIADRILQNIDKDNQLLRKEREELRAEVTQAQTEIGSMRVQMRKYEWDQYETRMLIIRLIEWTKRASEKLNTHNVTMENPPIKDLIDKFGIQAN